MLRRISVPAIAVIVFSLAATADDGAKSPEQVLKDAGLSRKGQSYILDDEIEAGKLAKGLEKIIGQLLTDVQNEMMLQMAIQNERLMASELSQEANFDRMQGGMMRGRGFANNQANNLSNQARNLQTQANNQNRQLGTMNQSISKNQKQFQEQQTQYKALVDKLLGQYEELSQRPEVVEALRSINKGIHPKYALGPIPAYRARVDRAMLDVLAVKGLAPTSWSFSRSRKTRSSSEPRRPTSLLATWRKNKFPRTIRAAPNSPRKRPRCELKPLRWTSTGRIGQRRGSP